MNPDDKTPNRRNDPDSMMILGSPEERRFAPGTLLGGKYRILRKIGTGGFASVFEAKDEVLGTRVAIKCLHSYSSHLADHAALKAEARRITRINHPNIVDWKVFDETDSGDYYFVMEYLQGESLQAVLDREGKLPAGRVGEILLEVLDALRAAHDLSESESILHLDLKPQHVFLESASAQGRPRVKVIDFGIGLSIGAVEDNDVPDGSAKEGHHRTLTRLSSNTLGGFPFDGAETKNRLLKVAHEQALADRGSTATADREPIPRCHACTPEYASPEQCAHMLPTDEIMPLDGRSDLYSLGILGFQMLSGKLPFDPPQNRGDWLRLHLEEKPWRLSAMGQHAPRGLVQFIDRCLNRDRRKRFADSDEAYRFLKEALTPSRIGTYVRIAIPTVVVATAIALSVRWFAPSAQPPLTLRIAGTQELTTDRPVYLGASNLWQTTVVADGLAPTLEVSAELVDQPSATADPIPGWTVKQSDPQTYVLHRSEAFAPDNVGPHRKTAWLRFTTGDGIRYSSSLELVCLSSTSWGFEIADVDGRRNRALDPRSLDLLVRIRARDLEDLEHGLLAKVGNLSLPTKLRGEMHRSEGSLIEYEVDLEKLAKLDERRHTFALSASDKTGFWKTERVTIDLATQDLTLDARLEGLAGGSVTDWTQVQLHVETNRTTDVFVSVLPNVGDTVAGRAVRGHTSEAIPLGEFAERLEDPLSGAIRITVDENDYVMHQSPEDGRRTMEIPFYYTTKLPSVAVRLLVDDTEAENLDRKSVAIATRNPIVEVQLARDSVPATIWIECQPNQRERNGADEVRRATEPIHLSWQTLRSHRERLSLPDDGEYLLRIFTARADFSADDSPRGKKQEWVVLSDTIPPRITLEKLSDTELVIGPGQEPPSCVIRVEEDSVELNRGPPSVALEWQIERMGVGTISLDEVKSDLPHTLSPSTPFRFRLPEFPAASDGHYRLTVTARDASGQTDRGQVEWHVAAQGPSLEVVNPRPSGEVSTWFQDADGGFALRVRAIDGNRVAEVRCTIVSSEGKIGPIALSSEDERGSLWKAITRFPRNWSGTKVIIHLEALDAFGNRSLPTRVAAEVEQFEEKLPRRISVVRPRESHAIGGMARIKGNQGPYLFGGRGDREENRLLTKKGLKPLSEGAVLRAWRLQCSPGTIPDFYLDTQEVSQNEFLAFVRSDTGYIDPRNWLDASRQEINARNAWETQLAADSTVPITGLTWDEAMAYAHWVGKRLPTRTEWEYALRNGSDYLPYPHSEPGTGFSIGSINADSVSAAPWPRGRGQDRSAAGVWNLAGNVREWTTSPYCSRKTAIDDLPSFLAPWITPTFSSAAKFWTVGGSFDSPVFDFFTAGGETRDAREDNLGFRCAISGSKVEEDLYRKAKVDRRFHAFE